MAAIVLFSAQGTATAAQSAENAERLYGAVLGKWVYPDETRLTDCLLYTSPSPRD